LPSAAWPVFPEPNRNHAPGVSSIRASSIRAIAIMTNAVETNRILGSPLSWCVTPPCLPNCMESFSSQFVLRARGLRHHDDTGSIRTKNRLQNCAGSSGGGFLPAAAPAEKATASKDEHRCDCRACASIAMRPTEADQSARLLDAIGLDGLPLGIRFIREVGSRNKGRGRTKPALCCGCDSA
jgi:hypothetical protein